VESTVIVPDEIRENLNKLGENKYLNGVNELYSSYYSSSKINKIIKAYDDRNYGYSFRSIGRRFELPIEWFNDDSHYLDYLFMQMGSDISFGEEIYLTNEIPSLIIEHIEITEMTRENLIEYIAQVQVHDRTLDEIVLFMPLIYHNKIYIDWMNDNNILRFNHSTGKFSFRTYPIDIIWSNKFNEFNTVIVLKPNFGRWICSPNIGSRLVLTSTLIDDGDKIEFIIKTDFFFEIVNRNIVKVIDFV